MKVEDLKQEEESKDEGEQTPPQNDSTEEKNDSQTEEDTSKTKDGEEHEEKEWTPPSKEEWEKAQKKATDFDGLLEKQRLQKLAGKTETKEEETETTPTVDEDKIKELVAQQVQTALSQINQTKSDDNLKDVYREFVKDNQWADSDETMAKIGENFDRGGAISKEDLRVKMDVAAQSTYPSQYNQSMESRIKSRILAEQNTIDAGDAGGGGNSVNKTDGVQKTLTKEQLEMVRLSGNKPEDVYPEYFTK